MSRSRTSTPDSGGFKGLAPGSPVTSSSFSTKARVNLSPGLGLACVPLFSPEPPPRSHVDFAISVNRGVSPPFVGREIYDPPMEFPSAAAANSHPLRMTGRGVFYSFSFDLGPGLDMAALADELLRTNMAAGAASPADDEIRIAKRGVALDREQNRLYHLHEFFNEMASDDFSWRRLFAHNRVMAIKVIRASRSTLLKRYKNRILYGQRPVGAARDESPQLPEWVVEAQKRMLEMSNGYSEMVFNEYILGAARIRLEQDLYFPGYLDATGPFIRIEMNPAYFSDRTYTDARIEISLMIHRSGICILTFAMPIDREFGVPEAFNYMQVKKRGLSKFSISFPIVGEPDRPVSLIESETLLWKSSHSGLDWLNAQIPYGVASSKVFTVEDIFDRYLYAISRAAGQSVVEEEQRSTDRLPGWHCHTTLFQGSPACGCTGNEAKRVHEIEFAQIMVRASIDMPVQDEVREKYLENHLIEANEELWLTAGNSIHTIWGGHRIDYIRDLRPIIAIELAILQHRQLQAIDHRTVDARARDHHLFSVQGQLATSLQEYGRMLLADQNGHRIIRGLAERLYTHDLYQRLNDRLKLLESIVNSRFTRLQSKRSLAVSLIGVAIVLALLLPRVTEFIEFANKLTPTSHAVRAVNDFFSTGNAATVATYVLIVLMAIGFFLIFPARLSFCRPRRRRRSFGYPTRGSLELISGPPDDEDGADRSDG